MFARIELEGVFKDQNGTVLDPDGIISYDIGPDWELVGDHYYYTKIVPANGFTSQIILKVCFDGETMNDDYQGATFTLTVKSEAIQVTHRAAQTEWEVNPLDL